jgi:hypothetical protein
MTVIIPQPSRDVWLTAYNDIMSGSPIKPAMKGYVYDLSDDMCHHCNGRLVRSEAGRVENGRDVFAYGVITCPESWDRGTTHPREVWLEAWYWPTGAAYLQFLKSGDWRSSDGLSGFIGKFGFDPQDDFFLHSDPRVPVCYLNSFLELPLVRLDGHDKYLPVPNHVHSDLTSAGLRPCSDEELEGLRKYGLRNMGEAAVRKILANKGFK